MIEQVTVEFFGPLIGPMVLTMGVVFFGIVAFSPILAVAAWALDQAVERERSRR